MHSENMRRVRDARDDGFPSAAARQFVRRDSQLDHRDQARLRCDVEAWLRLRLRQHEAGGVRGAKAVEALAQFELLSEVERAAHVGQAHRLEKEFLSCA